MSRRPGRSPQRAARVIALPAALALVCLACCSCGLSTFSGSNAKKMNAALEEVRAKYQIPGALARALSESGRVWAGAAGKADVENDIPMRTNMKFRIGSNTKSFTAVVVLQLVDEKKLALDDPLSKHLPEYSQWGKVTIRELLNMTSGIFNYTDDEAFSSAVEADPAKEYKPAQLVAFAAAHPPQGAPGGAWYYSNTNYILLGMIVEKVTGRTMKEEVTSRIIDKVDLKDTVFATGPEIKGSHSHGYWNDPETGSITDITNINPSMAWTAGCMTSDLDDMERWLEWLVEGRLLSESSYKAQMTFVETGMPFVKYGLGVFEVNDFVGNGGAIPGYNSAALRRPRTKESIVCVFNMHPVEGGRSVAMTDGLFALAAAMAGQK